MGICDTGRGIAAAVLALTGGMTAGDLAAEPTARNAVVFFIDDLGWGDIRCQGARFVETPNIDALAARGVRFTNGYAASPHCSPSRAAMLTGRSPARYGITSWIADTNARGKGEKVETWQGYRLPVEPDHLPAEEITIAELVSDEHFATASMGKWHLGESSAGPKTQGFDVDMGYWPWAAPQSWMAPYDRHACFEGAPKGEYITHRLTQEAVDFIKKNRDERFLLILQHYAVHKPLKAPRKMVERYIEEGRPDDVKAPHPAAYQAMIETVDQSVGEIVKTLDALDLAEDTLVIFTSDNGGVVGIADNGELREGKKTLYEGGIRVPFIVAGPCVQGVGRVDDTPVTGTDLMPTLAAALGASLPADQEIDGVDLTGLFAGRPLADRDLLWHHPLFAWFKEGGTFAPSGAIRRGDWKLIWPYTDRSSPELFNLAQDPAESVNLAAQHPDKVNELREALLGEIRRLGGEFPVDISAKQR